ncbi:hypothetical protein CJF42_20965 [Pseudoalteromonas sp. NBT06-2]|uniref:hypothetical protein n=1 Tax=Pseudoalteromonas sp. NBT06-2 TaxID=2025950 RepID=UPI000BA65E1C|nr:hypothetical protein [Pseudoalteromonas sp. NBT06-2]PAJ72468.1 hypothetical protein CJF42_20965 [Pseudoalteromonas sp. NBT06-2]
MILTFEGGPAIGKSTIANKLENSHGCYTIPEVNKLFGKENRISDLWYYQKQAQRWELALHNQESTVLSILDGDIFQPIWFSSLFPGKNSESFDETVNFYSEMMLQDKVGFPNAYIYFHAEERVRAKRERERSVILGRSQKSIEQKISRYCDFTTLQKQYFSDLKKEFPDLVIFLESNEIESTIQSILSFSKRQQNDHWKIFNFIVEWCRNKEPLR